MAHSMMVDIVFKIVFGTEQNVDLLRALVNALLGLTGPDRIVELQILNPVANREYLQEKGAVLDISARDGQGRQYNVEVQVWDDPNYVQRALYYLARLFSGQIEKGAGYDRLEKTVSISLVDYVLFDDLEDLHSTYRFYDAKHARELTDILEIHFIEMVKFRGDKPHALRTPFEKWLHILKFGELYESGLESLPAELREEEGIEMALDAMKKAYASPDVRQMIEGREKAMRDEATRMSQALREGRAEGLREAADRLLAQGMPREEVLRLLGLPPETLP